MSLFGGEVVGPDSDSQSDHDAKSYQGQLDRDHVSNQKHSAPPSDEVSPALEETSIHGTEYQDDAAITGSPSSYDSYESEHWDHFKGPSRTWARWTEEPRRIAQGLDQKRAENLSVHLLNTHALKHRLYRAPNEDVTSRTWPSKDRWIDSGQVNQEEGEDGNGENFLPGKAWTAWPLPPAEVPRPEERRRTGEEEECSTIRMQVEEFASSELEQVISSIMLKRAKEQWNERCSEAGQTESPGTTSTSEPPVDDATAGTDAENNEDLQRPVFSADDERAQKLLHPIVRSVISKLDNLLTALHHNAQNRVAAYDARSQSDTEMSTPFSARGRSKSRTRSRSRKSLESSGEPSRSRSRGRPRKHTPVGDLSTSPKGPGGRPRKYPKPNPGETYYMMRKRVAEEERRAGLGFEVDLPEKQLDGPTASGSATKPPKSPLPSSPSSSRASSRASSSGSHLVTMNPRDWSEVLGTALLAGWDPTVVDRASNRCANLFGEGIEMRTLHEDGDEVLTEYMPDIIDAFSSESEDLEPETEDDKTDDGVSVSESSASKGTSADEQNSTSDYNPKSLTCPFQTCRSYGKAYEKRYLFVQHMLRSHGIQHSPEDFGDHDPDEMEGAVHMDGFLRPIPPIPGVRGKDTRPSEDRREAAQRRWAKQKAKEEKSRRPGF